jgi:alkaline phosphatase D
MFYLGVRTYHDANDRNDAPEGKPFLGPEQMAWLKRELVNFKATWKVFAADMPIGMIVYDNWKNKTPSRIH